MNQSLFALRTFRCLGLVAVGLLVPAAVAHGATTEECPVPANQEAASGPALETPITLSVVEPDPPTEVINFDNGRGVKTFTVVLKSSSPLPPSLTPDQLEFSNPRPPKRVSANLESASLAFPTFSKPHIYSCRERISFQTCIDAKGASAGTYTDQISISGPSGLTGASVGVTANLKSLERFLFVGAMSLIAAFLLLLAKEANENKGKGSWLGAMPAQLGKGSFWGPTIFGLFAAIVAIVPIYANNPSWGADLWESLATLGGAAFGATGVGSLASSLVKGGG